MVRALQQCRTKEPPPIVKAISALEATTLTVTTTSLPAKPKVIKAMQEIMRHNPRGLLLAGLARQRIRRCSKLPPSPGMSKRLRLKQQGKTVNLPTSASHLYQRQTQQKFNTHRKRRKPLMMRPRMPNRRSPRCRSMHPSRLMTARNSISSQSRAR